MSKKCFVIMPFGSASNELKKKFDGVYKGIIVPAAREAGYEPIREDISATPGSITKDIITKLAESEMVIADLTNMNPNVFYELGIRHVFSKSGTVLLIGKGETIPFDNASHRVIQYTNELADLDDIHTQIVNAIINRENDTNNSDNVVHDTFLNLPISLVESMAGTVPEAKVNELRKSISELTKENHTLNSFLEKNGLLKDAYAVSQKKSVKERMTEARFALEKSGRNVVIQLRQFAIKDDIDGFVNCLEGALEAGYMTEDDYINVKELCGQLDLLPLQVAVMERAYDIFPDDDSIVRNLSDILIKMPTRDNKMRGVVLVEGLLGIKEKDGHYLIERIEKASQNNLAALFNAYGRLDLYDRTISICEFYETSELPQMPMVIRNKADAFNELKQIDEAQKTYKRLLEIDYYDDSNHAFYASFLSDINDYLGAYKEGEIAAILDINDPQHFLGLAVEILNNHYVRVSKQEIVKIPSFKKILLAVMPLFLYSLEIRDSNDLRTTIANILYKRNQYSYAQSIVDKKQLDQSDFNTYPLQFVLDADIEEIKGLIQN